MNIIAEKFIRYAKIDTQSNPHSDTFPSTEKQKKLLSLLLEELQSLGIDAQMDTYGYVLATIPSNVEKKVPAICFLAHVDTSPDCSGENVNPIVHKNYDGKEIILPHHNIVITPTEYPYLLKLIGDDIITADGNTLLGADDKAGVAILMQLAEFLSANTSFPHGDIQILFTPDEEIGKGVDKLDMKMLKSDFAYTLDGGEQGSIENENFCADSITFVFEGVMAHPGYAKNKLVNALKLCAEFITRIPAEIGSSETTCEKQGFVHPVYQEGSAEKCTLSFIIRAFDEKELHDKENQLIALAKNIIDKYYGTAFEVDIQEQYRNMKIVLDNYPHIVSYAIEAIKNIGLHPKIEYIRGGTDGSRLSFMGLPCANLFTGMMGIHSKKEFVSIQDMQKSLETVKEIIRLSTTQSLC